MTSVLTRRKSKTGRALARAMGLPRNEDAHVVIRWGTTRYSEAEHEINSAAAIALSFSKAEARKTLREAGLSVPVETETEFPIVARAASHASGSGLWFCRNEDELALAKAQGAAYFSKFYPKTREIRVHVAGGKTLLVSEKEGGDRSLVIWNHSRSNFKLRHLHRSVWLEDDLLRSAVRQAKKAVAALGLEFGAVDIMLSPTDGQARFVITEVNTAPALSPLAMEKYVAFFHKRLAELEVSHEDEPLDTSVTVERVGSTWLDYWQNGEYE